MTKEPYKQTLLGYKKPPAIINPDALLPAEKRKAQLDNWRTYDKKMSIIEKQKAEEEAQRLKQLEDEKNARLLLRQQKQQRNQTRKDKANTHRKTRQERLDNKENVSDYEIVTSDLEEESEEENITTTTDTTPATDNTNLDQAENHKNQIHKKSRRIRFKNNAIFLACCAADDTEEVKQLLANGQDVNARNSDGLTALHTACIDGKYQMCQLLVTHGANINAADNEGWTPLHAAAGSGHLRIANFLVGNMANVAAVNCDGNLASDVTDDRACKLLLDGALLRKRIRNEEDKSKARRIEETMILEYVEELKKKFEENPDCEDEIDLKANDKGANILHVCASKGYWTRVGKL